MPLKIFIQNLMPINLAGTVIRTAIAGLLTIMLQSAYPDSLSDEELTQIRDGFELRQQQALLRQVNNTFPSAGTPEISNLYAWNRLGFALAALYRNSHLEEANQAIMDLGQLYLDADPEEFIQSNNGLHWHGNLWVRIHELFGPDSRHFPGRLNPEAAEMIRAVLWEWASRRAYLSSTDINDGGTWRIWDSENHSAMRDATAWGTAKILRRYEPWHSMEYNDGSTAEQQYQAWTEYLIEYLRERGRRGMLVEYRSNSYSKYTLQCLYNYYDLSTHATLRYLARSFLDLWWADAALETIDGFAGGAATRVARPHDHIAERHAVAGMGWYYYGMGQELNRHPGHMCLITSEYRIPMVVMDIALDREGRGSYEYFSRRPGINVEGKENTFSLNRHYYVDPYHSPIVRYSYVTPDFVVGTHLSPKVPSDRWSGIHRSNRWHAILLRGEPPVLIMPQVTATSNNDRTQNEQWSVQRKGTLITQKHRDTRWTDAMRVYIPGPPALSRAEQDGWVFAWNELSYVAIKAAWGGYQWDDVEWLRLNDEYAPVIFEVARAADYEDIDDFIATVTQNPPHHGEVGGQMILAYNGLNDSGLFSFWTSEQSTRPPEINGQPIDYFPDFTFLSPYLNSEWGSGKVTIEKADRKHVLNFNADVSEDVILNPQWEEAMFINRGWHYLPGIGWFYPMGDWIYQTAKKWLFSPVSDTQNIWIYERNTSVWYWTSPRVGYQLIPQTAQQSS